jgi:hypothetical protein
LIGWTVRQFSALGYRRPMPSTGHRQAPAASLRVMERRRVLAGLAGFALMPAGLALTSCTGADPGPRPSGPSSGSAPPSPEPTPDPPHPDAVALGSAAADATALLAAYEATAARHPALAPVLAPYATDHDAHLSALTERFALPTTSPTSAAATSTTTAPASGSPSPGPSSTAPPVAADPGAARAALVQAEELTGETAHAAARGARVGEAARLLASIGASRAVHALLLGAPA